MPTKPGASGGMSFAECLEEFTSAQCSCPRRYVCNKGGDVCAETNTTGEGVSLAECQSSCLSPTEKYLCEPGGLCVVSLSGKGVTKEQCLSSCGEHAPV